MRVVDGLLLSAYHLADRAVDAMLWQGCVRLLTVLVQPRPQTERHQRHTHRLGQQLKLACRHTAMDKQLQPSPVTPLIAHGASANLTTDS